MESAGLLAKRVRRKEMRAADAIEAFAWLDRCGVRIVETAPLVPRALNLSLRLQVSSWDAVYLVRSAVGLHPLIRFL
jgi:predicted nucleic acid-binding protein